MKGLDACFQSFWCALTRKKVIDANQINNSKLKRNLNVFDLSVIGVAATLSSSIYVLLGNATRNIAGPGIFLSLIIDAIAALMSGVCYAEMAARIPMAGSAYTYTIVTMGESLGFFVAWNLLFEYAIGTALFARGFTGYLDSILNGKFNQFFKVVNIHVEFWGFETHLDFAAGSLCLILTVIIVVGWEPTKIIITFSLVTSVSVILVIFSVGLAYGSLANWSPFTPFGLIGVIRGASTCFYAFVGYDVIAMSAEETIKPKGTIPIAILCSICVSVVLFLAVAAVLISMSPYFKISVDATLVHIFQRNGLQFAAYIVFIGMIFGTIGGLTATLIPLPRLVYSMSKDGLLFNVFSKVNEKSGMPYVACITTGIFTAVVAFCFNTEDLVKMTSMGTLMAYSSVCLCTILLRYRMKSLYITIEDGMKYEENMCEEVNQIESIEDDEMNCMKAVENTSRGSNTDIAPHNKVTYGDKDLNHIVEQKNLQKNETDSDVARTPGDVSSMDSVISSSLRRIKDVLRRERFPTEKSETIVNLSCFCLVVQFVAISSIVVYSFKKLILLQLSAIVGLAAITASTFFSLMLISLQPENREPLFFKVPIVPWLPALSLFVNVYLIILLDRGSWIRFGIWLLVGAFLYFGYGIRHSKAGSSSQTEYTKLN